ncbi:MAG: hypothetical protein ACI9QN_001806 [Arcticibacterium sp.]|jgi:hypothetical protein
MKKNAMKRNLFVILLLLCPMLVFSQNIEVAGGIIADSLYVNSGIIRNVANPILAQDAATKAYVYLLEGTLASLEAKITDLEGVKDIDNNSMR